MICVEGLIILEIPTSVLKYSAFPRIALCVHCGPMFLDLSVLQTFGASVDFLLACYALLHEECVTGHTNANEESYIILLHLQCFQIALIRC